MPCSNKKIAGDVEIIDRRAGLRSRTRSGSSKRSRSRSRSETTACGRNNSPCALSDTPSGCFLCMREYYDCSCPTPQRKQAHASKRRSRSPRRMSACRSQRSSRRHHAMATNQHDSAMGDFVKLIIFAIIAMVYALAVEGLLQQYKVMIFGD